MRLLLDTNVWLWANDNPDRLGRAGDVIRDPESVRYVSAATAWELAVKVRVGKLSLPEPLAAWFPARLRTAVAEPLAVEVADAVAVAELPLHHRDPFDRLIVAQARRRSLTLVTSDETLAAYDVDLLLVNEA